MTNLLSSACILFVFKGINKRDLQNGGDLFRFQILPKYSKSLKSLYNFPEEIQRYDYHQKLNLNENAEIIPTND